MIVAICDDDTCVFLQILRRMVKANLNKYLSF